MNAILKSATDLLNGHTTWEAKDKPSVYLQFLPGHFVAIESIEACNNSSRVIIHSTPHGVGGGQLHGTVEANLPDFWEMW